MCGMVKYYLETEKLALKEREEQIAAGLTNKEYAFPPSCGAAVLPSSAFPTSLCSVAFTFYQKH